MRAQSDRLAETAFKLGAEAWRCAELGDDARADEYAGAYKFIEEQGMIALSLEWGLEGHAHGERCRGCQRDAFRELVHMEMRKRGGP